MAKTRFKNTGRDFGQSSIPTAHDQTLKSRSRRFARKTHRIQGRLRSDHFNVTERAAQLGGETTEPVGASAGGGIQNKKSANRHGASLVPQPPPTLLNRFFCHSDLVPQFWIDLQRGESVDRSEYSTSSKASVGKT